MLHDRRQLGVEELPLVDADDFGVAADLRQQVARRGQRCSDGNAQLAVRDDVILGVAGVDGGLEDLDPLPGDLGAAQPADQLLALAAEHAADDHFDPAAVRGSDDVHTWIIGVGRVGLVGVIEHSSRRRYGVEDMISASELPPTVLKGAKTNEAVFDSHGKLVSKP